MPLLSAYARLASSALDRAIASLAARMLSPPPSHEVQNLVQTSTIKQCWQCYTYSLTQMALAGVPGTFSERPPSSAVDPSEDPLASGAKLSKG